MSEIMTFLVAMYGIFVVAAITIYTISFILKICLATIEARHKEQMELIKGCKK